MNVDVTTPSGKALAVALGTANVVCALLYGWDKFRAIRGRRRVPEKTLLLASLPATAVGAWCAVFLFRHKVSKGSYLAKLILVTVVQAGCLYAFYQA